MNIIGFSSGTVGRMGNVDRMVLAILEKSGHKHEFVKLTDLVFSGCKRMFLAMRRVTGMPA